MELSAKILSDIVVYMKYAKYLPEKKRRETWEELVTRNKEMHIKRFPELKEEIEKAYKYVYSRQVLPSMRMLNFSGKPILISPSRGYNCSFLPIDHPDSFAEIMFLLLGGSGVGYSVQAHHIDKLPPVRGVLKRTRRFLVGDSVEGWADAVKVLMYAYFYNKSKPLFDFSDIREKGAALVTSGGKAPGPWPLRTCLHNITRILDQVEPGEKLTSLQVHDIVCFIADSVLSGGLRRAALISLFSIDDDEMISCKAGNWWEDNPQRGRANNSAVVLRHRITEEKFKELWKRVEYSNSGEPGIYFTNDSDELCNPSLRRGTKVLTTEGIFPIEELEGKEFRVKNLHGQTSDAMCFLSGKDKPLYKITLQNGAEIYATEEHKWPTKTRWGWRKKKTVELESGMRLPLIQCSNLNYGTVGDRDDGFFVGWLYGDGWITKRKDTGKIQYGMCVSKNDADSGILDKLNGIIKEKIGDGINFSDRGSTWECNFQNSKAFEYFSQFGVGKKEEGLPKGIWRQCSEEFRKGFIDGILSSDGTLSRRTTGLYITLYSSRKKMVEDLQVLFSFYGIKSYQHSVVKKGDFPNKKDYGKDYTLYSLMFSKKDSMVNFANNFSLTHKGKSRSLLGWLNEEKYNSITSLNGSIKIEKVEKTLLKEDVWDITVYDDTHCFQIEHCVTGNCGEAGLRKYSFCNLTEINVSDLETQEQFNERSKAAAFIGTLQASYTDFHYLRDIWKRNTEKDSLLGVSLTGIASNKIFNLSIKEAAKLVKEENERVSKILGTKTAARTTLVKPSGTASLVLGTSSGVHSWHSPYYVRRMRVMKNEIMYKYFARKMPELLEEDYEKPDVGGIICVPMKAPDGATTREESPLELLKRVEIIFKEWIKPGHRRGNNTHNTSVTVSIKPDEWGEVGDWMWKNRNNYNGISVLPYDGGTYKQAPFEEITKEKYEELFQYLKDIDLSEITEEEDNTQAVQEVACGGGGSCEITSI